MNIGQEQFRLLPSIDELLQSPIGQQLTRIYTRPLTLRALRLSLDRARAMISDGLPCPSTESLITTAAAWLEEEQRPHLQTVINATGVIINTNLGRAPLSQEALAAVRQIAGSYSNLEYELQVGERGSRHSHVETLLRELTGAEAALVVNNNAAALLLALSTLASGREVVISRGQLVEIGGGFRIPDVMRQSNCQLVEVGTTNRTRLSDYETALSEQTALLLTVHPSNFRVLGFTETTPLKDLIALAHERDLLVMEDLGSGCLLASEQYNLAHEPTPQESLEAGVDLVCFSGDKLLGGPQAGILVGKAEIIRRIARHPLIRAVRIDKMTLAALEATLRHYERGEASTHLPIWRMIAMSEEKIARRAESWADRLLAQQIPARTQPGVSTVGGGTLPGETLPTTLLALDASDLNLPLEAFSQRLRVRRNPIITRIQHDVLLFDPRTVLEEQDEEITKALIEYLQVEKTSRF